MSLFSGVFLLACTLWTHLQDWKSLYNLTWMKAAEDWQCSCLWMHRFLYVRMNQPPLPWKKKKKKVQTWSAILQLTDGARLALALLQKCHDVCIIHLPHKPTLSLTLPLLNVHMYQLAGFAFVPESWALNGPWSCLVRHGKDRMWNTEWIQHESVFISVMLL